MKNKIFFLTLILIFASTLSFAQDLPKPNEFLEQGRVTAILDEKHDKELEELFMSNQIVQTLKIKILTGALQNQEVKIENYLTSNPAYDINIKKGDRVVLEMDNPEDNKNINITAKDNSPIILIILGIFALLLIMVAGYKGMKSLISTLFTMCLISFLLVPLILNGFSPIITTICISIISIIFNMFILGGINIKSIGASLGTILSLLFAGLLSLTIIHLASLNGISSQEGLILWEQYPQLNFKGVLTSAMIIGALGATMSTGLTIATSINEAQKSQKDYGLKELFTVGLNIGKDIVGPMTNTLIFAYIGSSLPLLLLSFDMPFIKFINFNSVIAEILAALIGSIAIISCVPITAIVSAYLIYKFKAAKKP